MTAAAVRTAETGARKTAKARGAKAGALNAMKAGPALRRRLLQKALAYPGAWEDHPWGETVVKVGKKVFVFLGMSGEGLHLSCKLPDSFDAALSLFSFAEETGYGLGAAGWVTATFEANKPVPVELMLSWIDESYRAIAPKKLVKQLGAKA
jgi:predicted DNA-binding protein (MmcQ/YjbR family)